MVSKHIICYTCIVPLKGKCNNEHYDGTSPESGNTELAEEISYADYIAKYAIPLGHQTTVTKLLFLLPNHLNIFIPIIMCICKCNLLLLLLSHLDY